jgi:hypothetical protein
VPTHDWIDAALPLVVGMESDMAAVVKGLIGIATEE